MKASSPECRNCAIWRLRLPNTGRKPFALCDQDTKGGSARDFSNTLQSDSSCHGNSCTRFVLQLLCAAMQRKCNASLLQLRAQASRFHSKLHDDIIKTESLRILFSDSVFLVFCGCCALQSVVLRGVQARVEAQVEVETSATFHRSRFFATHTHHSENMTYGCFSAPGIIFSVCTGKSPKCIAGKYFWGIICSSNRHLLSRASPKPLQ